MLTVPATSGDIQFAKSACGTNFLKLLHAVAGSHSFLLITNGLLI